MQKVFFIFQRCMVITLAVPVLFSSFLVFAYAETQLTPIETAMNACTDWIEDAAEYEFRPEFTPVALYEQPYMQKVSYLSREYPILLETQRFLDSAPSDLYCEVRNIDIQSETIMTVDGRRRFNNFREEWQSLNSTEAHFQIDGIIASLVENPNMVDVTALFADDQSESPIRPAYFVNCELGPILEIKFWLEDGPVRTFGRDWSVMISKTVIVNSHVETLALQLRDGCPQH